MRGDEISMDLFAAGGNDWVNFTSNYDRRNNVSSLKSYTIEHGYADDFSETIIKSGGQIIYRKKTKPDKRLVLVRIAKSDCNWSHDII